MDRSTPSSFTGPPVETSYSQYVALDNEYVNPRPVVYVIQDGEKPHTRNFDGGVGDRSQNLQVGLEEEGEGEGRFG
ncbi:hypothetical protein L1887_08851 [Cichorium endivia]|nr:hypothetical protein L1887_08851 [Cichorium endivia]